MRKVLCVFLLLAAVIRPGAVCAEEGEMMYDNIWDEYAEEYRAACSLENDTLTLFEGVATLGYYPGENDELVLGDAIEYNPADPDSIAEYQVDPEIRALFNNNPGRHLAYWGNDVSFSRVNWPSTIRRLGQDSFRQFHFESFTLPASLERIYPYALGYCHFDVLRIECVLPYSEAVFCGMYDCGFGAIEVPEDHPLFKSVDGVLYSRDGKTLLRYPNERETTHFDVPAGVECIASGAFEKSRYLRTVSLPIGLKKIEDYTFLDCYELQSLSVPLTVTEIGSNILEGCISMERVSLPEGMQTERYDNPRYYIYYRDDSLFRGDNWDTGFDSRKMNEDDGNLVSFWKDEGVIRQSCPAWLADTETVPVYNSSKDGKTVSTLPGGTPVYVRKVKDSRCDIEDVFTEEEIGWVDMDQLQMFNNESLFYYHDYGVRPPKDIRDEAGSTGDEDWEYPIFKGPWVWFPIAKEMIPLADAELYCLTGYPEGMGIVVCKDPLAKIPLLAAPEGTEITSLHVGTQIRVLEDKDSWVRVTTGFEEGWLKKEQIRIVLPVTDMKEE